MTWCFVFFFNLSSGQSKYSSPPLKFWAAVHARDTQTYTYHRSEGCQPEAELEKKLTIGSRDSSASKNYYLVSCFYLEWHAAEEIFCTHVTRARLLNRNKLTSSVIYCSMPPVVSTPDVWCWRFQGGADCALVWDLFNVTFRFVHFNICHIVLLDYRGFSNLFLILSSTWATWGLVNFIQFSPQGGQVSRNQPGRTPAWDLGHF